MGFNIILPAFTKHRVAQAQHRIAAYSLAILTVIIPNNLSIATADRGLPSVTISTKGMLVWLQLFYYGDFVKNLDNKKEILKKNKEGCKLIS